MNLDKILTNEKNKEIDPKFHNFFEDTLNNLPDKKKKKKLRISKTLVASMLFLVLTPIITIYSSDIIENVLNISNVLKDAEASGLYLKYTANEPIEVDLKDYKVIINNIGYHDNFLIYAYSLEKKNGENITDEDYMNISLSIAPNESTSGHGGEIAREVIDNKYTSINWFYLNNFNINDDIEVTISIYDNSNISKTEKNIKVKLYKSNQSISKTVKLNKEIRVPEGTIYLNEITFSPFLAVLKCENRGNINALLNYSYRLFDESGNQLWTGSTGLHDFEEFVQVIKTIETSQYIDKEQLTIKLYDSRTSEEVPDSSITIDIPKIN